MTPNETITLSDDTLEQAAEWVVRLNDPRATEDDFSEWQRWLAQDAANVQAFHEVQDAWQRASAVADVIAAPKADHVAPAMPRTSRSAFRWSWTIALAASVLLVCGIILWPTMPTTLSTATAELRSVKLPDGSRVSLGPETQLRLSFSERERLISMQSGEAYFEVAPDADRPFSVKTPSGTVVAVGTAFSVHALTDRIAVAVTHGKVRVETGSGPVVEDIEQTDGASATQPVVLVTGQRFVRERERTTIDTLPSLDSATAWQQRRLEYNDAELRVVIADINRYSATKLEIEASEIAELRYTGTVFPDEIDVWLESIKGVFPVHVNETGSNRVITTRE
jgi:transmembrane sensor